MSPSDPQPSLQVVGAAIVRPMLPHGPGSPSSRQGPQHPDEVEVLCAKRPPGGDIGGKWEFVGGKIEVGETPHQALVRECFEEVGLGIVPGKMLAQTTLPYPRGLITLTTFLCALADGEPTALEHEEIRWVPISGLHHLDWAPLDLPAVAALQSGNC